MDILLAASIACGVIYRSWWRQPVLPVIGVVVAVIYGLWRGGASGTVFAALAVAVNVGVLAFTIWWPRHRSTHMKA